MRISKLCQIYWTGEPIGRFIRFFTFTALPEILVVDLELFNDLTLLVSAASLTGNDHPEKAWTAE